MRLKQKLTALEGRRPPETANLYTADYIVNLLLGRAEPVDEVTRDFMRQREGGYERETEGGGAGAAHWPGLRPGALGDR